MRKKIIGTTAIITGGVFAGIMIKLILDRSSFPEAFESLIFALIGLSMIGALYEIWKE